ncbi:tyrosinase [Setomelanomma holmii]|uniref:tyrosinase n=1 Tax=Setomelanomma holmii TaxID=210430 RepID=A0A9P4LI39_9PLEO|nr:tyrosinase [Setomelanomma holmii]
MRREIRDLKDNHPEQWNLYLLALDRLHWQDQSDPLSYYGLASIHGRPFRTWGNAPGLDHKIGTSGYCPHSNMLFLGWHRPYLALFEEQLYKEVQWLAARATPDRAQLYETVAKEFRMPFWDWAKGESDSVPDFFTLEYIAVSRPDGSHGTIWNPLYAYYFHPVTADVFDSKWVYLNATQRWPTSDAIDSVSQNSQMISTYQQQARALLDNVDQAFRADTINDFANLVEQAHGWVHGIIGGGYDSNSFKGHMWPLEYSAYEPMFMLHHTNVDRLFAMYQAAHPDRNFLPTDIGNNGNVWLEDGTTVDANTTLLPFRKSSGGFWTTNDSRNTTTFGYAYPETVRARAQSDEDYWTGVNAAITTLYGSSIRATLSGKIGSAGQTLPLASTGTSLLANDGTFTDWEIYTTAQPLDLPPTFVVRFSLVGDFSSDAPVDVGTWTKLMPASHGQAGKVKRASLTDVPYQGRISLTASLIDCIAVGKLASLNAADVVPYLKDKLTWKVISDQQQLPQSDLNALTFEIFSTTARIPSDPNKPIEYSKDIVPHPEVTIGKAGGVVVQA